MKLHVAGRLPASAGMTLCLLLLASAMAEEGGYVPPRFLSNTNQELAARALPRYPASPLAGGPAAAQGGSYMDAQGNPIILPASYSQAGGGGYGGFGGAANYGDPMAVNFGGYGPDQSGPHYFDVSIDTVFLQAQDPFDGVPPLISVGVSADVAQGNRIDVLSGQEEYQAGWRIAARYDLGPLSVIEGTYMGIYDIGFNSTINSLDATVAMGLPPLPNQLFRAPTFGIPVPINTLDAANVYSISYKSDLQSAEFSYRRYWMAQNSRVSGTFLLGTRYLRMTEGFAWNTQAVVGINTPATSNLNTTSENDLLGFQLGGDGWFTLRQGLRIGTEVKAGIYNNRYKLGKTGVFDQVGNAPANFDVRSEGNQVAFAAEGGVTMVADILSSWSIRGGYQVMYLSSLATVADNFDTTTIGAAPVSTQGDALYHGFHGGLEYTW